MKFRTQVLSLVLAFILTGATAYAQVGVRAGLNIANQKAENPVLNTNPTSIVGLNLGVSMEFPLTDQIALQPELHFIQKGGENSYDGFVGRTTFKTTINYIELAVVGKFYVWKMDNGPDLYLGIAPYVGLAVSGEQEYKNPFESETISITFDDDYKAFDYGAGAGIGGVWGSFFLDVRYNLGIADINNFPYIHDSIKNRGVLLGLGYLF